jgi:hypothetical protein
LTTRDHVPSGPTDTEQAAGPSAVTGVTCTHPVRTSGEVCVGPVAEVNVPDIVASLAAIVWADDVVEAAVSDPDVQEAERATTSSPSMMADAFTLIMPFQKRSGRAI